MKNFNFKILVVLLFGAISCEDKLDMDTESSGVLSFQKGVAGSQSQSISSARTNAQGGNAPLYDGSDSGPIDLSVARVWVQNFKDNVSRPDEVTSHYFGRDVIDQILRQDGCTGIQIYYALDDSGEKKIIITGVDSKGNTMLPTSSVVTPGENILADFSWPCPDMCPTGSL